MEKRLDYKTSSNYLTLNDLAASLEHGRVASSRRVQVKMPDLVVQELDAEFPNIDRSQIITQAALELLMRKKRIDHPELERWHVEEQYDLDRMWHYLDERETR